MSLGQPFPMSWQLQFTSMNVFTELFTHSKGRDGQFYENKNGSCSIF